MMDSKKQGGRKNDRISESNTDRSRGDHKKDVTKAYLRWHFANEIPHSFERYLAPSLLYAMMPILRKLYKNEDAPQGCL